MPAQPPNGGSYAIDCANRNRPIPLLPRRWNRVCRALMRQGRLVHGPAGWQGCQARKSRAMVFFITLPWLPRRFPHLRIVNTKLGQNFPGTKAKNGWSMCSALSARPLAQRFQSHWQSFRCGSKAELSWLFRRRPHLDLEAALARTRSRQNRHSGFRPYGA